ncbi:MAG: hypothetical protein D6677_02035 [Calditrichaeota bacterium]|nr:MAG: hypothetical protein D6677_02035 [Calditrichota bacterium]
MDTGYILGISAYYHDSAAALLKDGRIVAAAQEERFTRKKHDHRFPEKAVRYCLEEAGIGASELQAVAFYDKPFVKFNRLLETYLACAPRGLASFLKAMPLWLRQKLWIPDQIKKALDYDGPVLFTEHHGAHAASAWYPSPFEEAAVLTIDGVGEWATASWGVAAPDTGVRLLSEMHFPHSPGLLYSAFTYFTGFRVNSGEYKLMGLAPYGEPRYVDMILDELVELYEDGSFRLNMDYFNYPAGLTMTNRRFARLFGGPPRAPESPLTQREMDMARSIQEVIEKIVLKMARHIRKETGRRYLCMAGGVALNCVANGKLLRSGIFDDIWIQPAAGDAGGALGAALQVWHEHYGHPVDLREKGALQQGSYLGPAYDDADIAAFLNEKHIPAIRLEDSELFEETARALDAGDVIGWFQGRMEFGPRALGNRSIIGDARSPKMQKRMNLKIKYRESFRPFAPSVLAEHVSDWFETDHASPYMLLVADVKKERQLTLDASALGKKGLEKLSVPRSEIPAVTHVDGSARLQTVHRDTNPRYHALISAFYTRTGCPVIVNTSFNVRGEPIVATPEDAYACFMNTEMDRLVLGNYMLRKNEQPRLSRPGKRRSYELD